MERERPCLCYGAPIPYSPNAQGARHMEEMCHRAVRVLRQDLRVTKELGVAYDHQQRLAYCINCFTSRKIRDQHFVASAPWPGNFLDAQLPEVSYMGHRRILWCEMRRWKRAAARPDLICQLCDEWYWPHTISRRPPYALKQWGNSTSILLYFFISLLSL